MQGLAPICKPFAVISKIIMIPHYIWLPVERSESWPYETAPIKLTLAVTA